MNMQMKENSKQHNSPVVWFCVLERAKQDGNFELAAKAKNELQMECYSNPRTKSSLKEQIGEILLLLLTSNGQPDVWLQFETILRKFYEVNL